ncbi:MAG: hypothetical protein RLZZ522_792 [Verrucomicrobiota bacterium]
MNPPASAAPVSAPGGRVGWWLWLVPLIFGVVSCGLSRPSGYRGYQTKAYTVRGQTYHPMSVEAALDFKETGICSWYNESSFFGLKRGTTSLGEKVMPWHLIGAHKTLPLPSLVKVTNLETGQSVKVRINDRGPFIAGRSLDLSPRAAKKIGFYGEGLTTVRMEVLAVGDGSYQRRHRHWWPF